MIIDFHSHILPKLDHGTDSLECSLNQLKAAKKAGVNVIVATSHFYSGRDNIDRFILKRQQALEVLNDANNTGIKIIPAAEVQISHDLADLDKIEYLAAGTSGYILLEMPNYAWNNRVFDTILKVEGKCGLKAIIAHVDRYPKEDVEKIFELGVKAQLNAEALASVFGKKRYVELIRCGKIHVLGSDVHKEYQKSYKNFEHALNYLGDTADILMRNAKKFLCL